MAGKPALGWVTIRSSDPPITIQARLAADRPNVDQGYGGWTEVARPHRSTLSIWTGQTALRMTLPILLDRWRSQSSVELQIAQLERLALPSASDRQPARVRIVGRGGAIPHQGRVWVIDNLAWGDALMNANGNRVRQQVNLSLLEYIADVRVSEDSASNRARAKAAAPKRKAGASSKRIVAGRGRTPAVPHLSRSALATSTEFGAGDDLLSIAARELGDADRWPEIAALNGIRDPRSIAPGQVIRLP